MITARTDHGIEVTGITSSVPVEQLDDALNRYIYSLIESDEQDLATGNSVVVSGHPTP